jgi:hypothetical protein
MSRFCTTLSKAILVLFLLTCVCEYTIAQPHRYTYDPNLGLEEEDIREQFNLYSGHYWNYYARGSMFLAWDHYQAAAEDFRIALNKRPRDQRDARTYGMHFTDHFPNRELGVVYCFLGEREANVDEKQKLFIKAIAYLETSLSQAKSSRAIFFLNRARAGFWTTTNADTTPPEVWIDNDTIDRWKDIPTLYIKGYEATLEIRASDNESLVGTVWLDSRRLYVESAVETFQRDALVTLDRSDEEKTVVVKAVDLAGNESRPAIVRLIVDTVPPSAVARVHPDKARLSLLGASIPVDIVAEDDRGLKSVRVGEDPYDNRDCRGKVTWEGRFFAEPGERSLTVEITDKAGNITLLKVNLEPGQSLGIRRGERLPGYNASLDHGQSPRKGTSDVIQRGTGNLLGHLVQFCNVEINSFTPRFENGSLLRPAANEYGFNELVFSGFEYKTTHVPALRPSYLLQAQVEHANGLWAPGSIHSVILLPLENEYSPGEPSKQFASWEKTNEDSVPDDLWDNKYIYSIIIAPLQNEYSERDPEELYPHQQRANKTVLRALRNCREGSHCRFNCKAFEGWDADEMDKVNSNLAADLQAELEPETRSRLMAKKLIRDHNTDLAIYGLVSAGRGEFNVKIKILDRDYGEEPLFHEWIEVFSRTEEDNEEEELEYCIDGLIVKLKENIPRLRGRIIDRPKGKTIYVNFGKRRNIFPKMSLLLCDALINNNLGVRCSASVDRPYRRDYWRAELGEGNRRYIEEKWKGMLVVSK